MVPRDTMQVVTFLIASSRSGMSEKVIRDVSVNLIFAVQVCCTSQGQDIQRLLEKSLAHPPESNCDEWQWDDLQAT